MKKNKLKLDEIKIESFITSLEGSMIQGGVTEPTAGCGCTYECLPQTGYDPGTNPYPCQPSGCQVGSGYTACVANTCAAATCAQTCAATCAAGCGTSDPGNYTAQGTYCYC